MYCKSPPQSYNQTFQSITEKQGKDDIEKSLVRLFCLLDLVRKRFRYNLSSFEQMEIESLINETRNIYLDYVLEDI